MAHCWPAGTVCPHTCIPAHAPSLCPTPWLLPALTAHSLLLGRRHTPYGNQTDYRIFELNKRLQNWTEVGSQGLGWEANGRGGC